LDLTSPDKAKKLLQDLKRLDTLVDAIDEIAESGKPG
jgi:hypothetical protein